MKVIIVMCGNQISSVVNPNDQFRTLIAPQIRNNRIALKSYPINSSHTMQLQTFNTAAIKELELEKCKINHQTLENLLKINFASLSKLNLNDNEIGPIGCRILGGSTIANRLTSLSLNKNKVKDSGLKFLSQGLQTVEDLSLNDNEITTDGIAALRGKVDCMQYLSLGGNRLNDKSIAILKNLSADQIVYLKLSRNDITDEGLKQILKCFTNLQILLMERNKIKSKRDNYKEYSSLFLFY